jgi:hypothetical protein
MNEESRGTQDKLVITNFKVPACKMNKQTEESCDKSQENSTVKM